VIDATAQAHLDRHIDDWACYTLGIVLTLGYKWMKYVKQRQKSGVSIKDATIEWFFEPSADNVTSWTVTIGLLWTFGTVYIFHIDIGFGDWFQKLPVMAPLSFLFGALLELYAPAAARWVMSKMPWGQSSTT
jgi:hypothetical protein